MSPPWAAPPGAFWRGADRLGVGGAALPQSVEQAGGEGVLRREVIEQPALRHAGGRDDGVECDGRTAVLDQQRLVGVQHAVAGARHPASLVAAVFIDTHGNEQAFYTVLTV